MEGVMMRGPKAMCIAVRRPDGGIETEVTPVVMKPWQKWPFVRGIYNMAENLVVGYRCLMRSADISMTEEEKEESESKFDRWVEQHLGEKGDAILMGVASFAGVALVREKILEGVWGENYYGDVKIVDVNIRRLRMKIEDEPSAPRHIMTVWGYGYRWNS